jgi:hypothetical protein
VSIVENSNKPTVTGEIQQAVYANGSLFCLCKLLLLVVLLENVFDFSLAIYRKNPNFAKVYQSGWLNLLLYIFYNLSNYKDTTNYLINQPTKTEREANLESLNFRASERNTKLV